MTSERTFEQALAELEDCVRRLDGGDLPLEESLAVFERGVRLQQECQELLDASERRIVELTRGPDGIAETPMVPLPGERPRT